MYSPPPSHSEYIDIIFFAEVKPRYRFFENRRVGQRHDFGQSDVIESQISLLLFAAFVESQSVIRYKTVHFIFRTSHEQHGAGVDHGVRARGFLRDAAQQPASLLQAYLQHVETIVGAQG